MGPPRAASGVMWPMIAAYGTRLVPEHMHGKAITVIMSGNTLGISIGLPVMTSNLAALRKALALSEELVAR